MCDLPILVAVGLREVLLQLLFFFREILGAELPAAQRYCFNQASLGRRQAAS